MHPSEPCEGYELVAEMPIDDPECGSGGSMRVLKRLDPSAGPQISIVVMCPEKGYRYFEEIPESIGAEKVIVIRVNTYEDLSRIILRSRDATIIIPEIGLISTPRSAATDEILTIDGILEKYIDHLEPVCESTEDPGRCREVVAWMKRAMRGEERFTVIIEDPSGRSKEIAI